MLEPLSVLTKQLQDEQLTIPGFNEGWVKADLALERVIKDLKWKMAEKLLELVRGRRLKIDENPIIMAGIFLDPRMWRSLTVEKRNTAKQVIGAVCSVSGDDDDNTDEADTNTSRDGEPSAELDNWGMLVGSLASPIEQSQLTPEGNPNSIEYQLRQYEFGHYNEPVTHTTDPTEFWLKRAKNITDPLHSLAVVALSIITCPVTEVTAERLFSLLGYVYNNLRTCLKMDILEDILFCMWNKISLRDEDENPLKRKLL